MSENASDEFVAFMTEAMGRHERIEQRDQRTEKLRRMSLRDARKCGRNLIAAKKLCKHGQWLEELEHYFKKRKAKRTVQGYMRIARNWSKCKDAKGITEASRILASEKQKEEKKKRPKDPLEGRKREWHSDFQRWSEDLTEEEMNFGEEKDGSGVTRLIACLNAIKKRKDDLSDNGILGKRAG